MSLKDKGEGRSKPLRGLGWRDKGCFPFVCVLVLSFCSRMPNIEHNCKYVVVPKLITLKYKWETWFFKINT